MFILKLIIRILALFILISLSFSFELIRLYWDDSNWFLSTRIILHSGIILLIFLLIKKYLLKYWSLRKSFIGYVVFCILSISIVSIHTRYSDRKLGIKQFNYPVASCFEFGRGLFSNSFSTYSFNHALKIFPFSIRYLVLSATDGCRILQIKNKVSDPVTREMMCPGQSKISCIKEVINETSISSSYTITGKILLIAVSALYAFEVKEEYKIKDHPLLNEEIKERGKILTALHTSASLLDVLSLLESRFIADKGVPGLFDDFPTGEIEKIPTKVKEEIARAINEDIRQDNDYEMHKMAFGIKNKYSQMAKGLDHRVLDGYLIMLFDEQLSGKMDRISCSKLDGIHKEILKKVHSEKYKKSLTSEELEMFELKFNEFSKRREYCKKIKNEQVTSLILRREALQ